MRLRRGDDALRLIWRSLDSLTKFALLSHGFRGRFGELSAKTLVAIRAAVRKRVDARQHYH